MKRQKPITRSRVKRSNPKRKAKNHLRAYGGAKLVWIHAQPCLITGLSPVEAVHVTTGGMGFKADAKYLVPMVSALHRQLHRVGRQTFEATHHVNLLALARRVESEWQSAGLPHGTEND